MGTVVLETETMSDKRAIIEVAVNKENLPEVLTDLREALDEDQGEEMVVPEEYLYGKDWFGELIDREVTEIKEHWEVNDQNERSEHTHESADWLLSQMSRRQKIDICDMFDLKPSTELGDRPDSIEHLVEPPVAKKIRSSLESELEDRGYRP